MVVEFFDTQDDSNPSNGRVFDDGLTLGKLLDRLRKRKPFICEIAHTGGSTLDVGVGPDLGFVQFNPANASGPSLLALHGQAPLTHGEVEFLSGDTPTPIPAQNCLPFDLVKGVVADFVETGARSARVSWKIV